MTRNIEAYKGAAMTTFEQLKKNYGWSGNFWRLGHSFDTVIDYFDTVGDSEAALFGAEYALAAFRKFTGHWYDDYGWWGLAALKASQRPALFGKHAGEFQAIALRCWNFMLAGNTAGMEVDCSKAVAMAGAPNVWAQSQKNAEKARFKRLEPLFDGGVWNCDWRWSADKDSDPCYCVPIYQDPDFWAKDGLGGFQNTVTNALFLALASRINKITNGYDAAVREYQFLQNWFDRTPALEALLCPLGHTGGSFVRERVSVYKSGGGVYAYRQDLAWAGDQGALLSGLVDYMGLVSSDDLKKKLRQLCKELIEGTRLYLADKDNGGVLRDWWDPYDPKNSAPGGDVDDYRTGSGAYMRFLVHAYQRDSELKKLMETDEQQDFIAKNADAIDLLPRNLSIEQMVIVLTNNLAKLVAAIVMLKR